MIPALRQLASTLAATCAFSVASAQDDGLRLNEIQLIGTHNSYHIAPARIQLEALSKVKKEWGEALDYTHSPLAEQLGELGVRHFELDLFADPEGGHFARPRGLRLLPAKDIERFQSQEHFAKMKAPGFKVLHVPDFDFRSTVPTLVDALGEVKVWSEKNPNHLPIFFLLEMKDDRPIPFSRKPVPFDRAQLEAVEREILSVFDKGKIITPDSVRDGAPTLREAILDKAWPLLAEARGKVMFGLDNGGRIRDLYLKDNPSLEGRLMFASVGEKSPAAAWFKLNDPIRSFEQIQRLVRAGFMVRTRADAETREARANDTRRRDKALASGAQFISTDFPEPVEGVPGYSVRFEDGKPFRHNPVR